MNLQSHSLPPRIDVPEVAKAAEEWRKLYTDHAAAAQQLFELEEARHHAVEADASAYGAAIRSGKPDPGEVATKKCDADLIDRRRRVSALEKAVGSAEADLLAAVERHRTKWTAELDQAAATAQQAYADAVEAVEGCRRRLCEVRATAGWLRRFPGRPVYKPVSPGVAGLVARHGDGYSWDEVLAALRADAAGLRPVDAAPVLRPADAAPVLRPADAA
jgi:leucyl aminopeptidase (aminopeptidase T)